MVLTRDRREKVKQRAARDLAFARIMFNEAAIAFLNGEPHAPRLILHRLVNASVGFEELAAATSCPSKSLHRMLSEKGNSNMDNLAAIFGAVRKRLVVEFSLGKLYTGSFYHEVTRLLAADGLMTVQSTSPLVAPRSYWTVASTLEAAGLSTRGYHAYVPSSGEWGFTLAAHRPRRRWRPPAAALALPDHRDEARDVQFFARQRGAMRSFAQEWAPYES